MAEPTTKPAEPLHDFLAARQEDVLERWKKRVESTLAPDSVHEFELLDDIPKFVADVIALLRAGGSRTAAPALRPLAAGHGAQRLRLGFSLESVVREYAALRDAILDTAQEAGVPITLAELQVVFDAIVEGIVHASSEYARRRDAELLRQANEHYALIAHELRNPLASARMALQLLLESGALRSGDDAVGALERGLGQVVDLVDHTLKVARIGADIVVRPHPTTLRQVAEGALQEVSMGAATKHVALRSSIEDREVELDPRLMRSALGNLLQNAVKYTPAGGEVCLRVRVDGGNAIFEVEDRCGGLPRDWRPETAFVPFVRMHDGQDGFGLGLAIARQAISAHGGSIHVRDLPGTGCVFALELPISIGPGRPARVTAAT